MANLTQDQVKALFETDDRPTQSDFVDLIDTLESNSAVISTSVTGTDDVWVDFNATTNLATSTKEVNIVIHNGTFYMFNAVVGTYGLGGTATDTTNFIGISAAYELGKVGVKQVILVNTNATTQDATTLAIDFTSLDPPLIHEANQTSIVRYADEKSYMYNTWWLIDAEPGTYGLGESTLGAGQFIQVGLERYSYALRPTTYTIAQAFPGASNVWDDLNLVQGLTYHPSVLTIIDHPTGVYLFDYGPPGDKGEYNDWGLNNTPSTSSNFSLILDKADVNLELPVTEAAFLTGTGSNIDFSAGVNFDVVVDGTANTPLVVNYPFTATNLVDGQSGYIRVSRGAVGLQAATYFTFSSDFIPIVSGTPIIDGNNYVYYFYEIVAPTTGNIYSKVVIKTSIGETALWI